jgi:hypothetical protein
VQPLKELMDRGYEDAYRQFIEPVVGASGEQLTRQAATLPPRQPPSARQTPSSPASSSSSSGDDAPISEMLANLK